MYNGRLITRREIYALVWQRPISEVAAEWRGDAAHVIEVCAKLNIPLPGPDHWKLIQQGQQVERTPLPPPERDTMIGAEIPWPAKVAQPKPPPVASEPPKPRSKVEIPKGFENAHPLVAQTRKALTTDMRLSKGLLETSSRLRQPLAVLVSPGQLDRALLICDAVVKGIIGAGGRFKMEPQVGVRLFIGKQAVTFQIRETVKKFFLDGDMTDEEKAKEGYHPWDKYGWKGSGRLRFSMFVGELYDRTWHHSKRLSLEDQVGEIIDELAEAEEEAERERFAREERDKRWAEEQALREEECQRRRTAEEAQKREVALEEESRARLVQKARDWREARILRRFIGACQRKIEAEPELQGDKAWGKYWFRWASEQADRLDPATSGFLEAEKRRITGA